MITTNSIYQWQLLIWESNNLYFLPHVPNIVHPPYQSLQNLSNYFLLHSTFYFFKFQIITFYLWALCRTSKYLCGSKTFLKKLVILFFFCVTILPVIKSFFPCTYLKLEDRSNWSKIKSLKIKIDISKVYKQNHTEISNLILKFLF